MNAAWIVPFSDALVAAMLDPDVARNANLMNRVYDACEDDSPRIYTERPDEALSSFVVLDIPIGGRSAYVHGTDGDPVAEWTRFQATAWASTKRTSLLVMDAVLQAIDGRDIVVSDNWGTVRVFKRSGVINMEDVISSVVMWGAFARFEVLLVS